jgi:hypothetical protein
VAAYLVVLTDQSGLAWVVESERLGWRMANTTPARVLSTGDEVFLYAGRRAVRLPGWEGAVVGVGTVLEPASILLEPEMAGGREIGYACPIKLRVLVRPDDAVPLRSVVGSMTSLGDSQNPQSWSGHLQRSVIALTDADRDLLSERLDAVQSIHESKAGYPPGP